MSWQRKPVTKNLNDYPQIVQLMRESFPKEQLVPLWQLRLLAKIKPGNKFTAYYDGEELAGVSFSVENRTTVFVLYLTVSTKIRSQGYGSRIIQQLISEAGSRSVVLDIEEENILAANAEQRVKRKQFYHKHGFRSTGYALQEGTERFEILATTTPFDVADYRKILASFSLGFYRPQVVALD